MTRKLYCHPKRLSQNSSAPKPESVLALLPTQFKPPLLFYARTRRSGILSPKMESWPPSENYLRSSPFTETYLSRNLHHSPLPHHPRSPSPLFPRPRQTDALPLRLRCLARPPPWNDRQTIHRSRLPLTPPPRSPNSPHRPPLAHLSGSPPLRPGPLRPLPSTSSLVDHPPSPNPLPKIQ